jgi:hypothetical protein
MRSGSISKHRWLFWTVAVLAVAYGVARITDVPSLQAEPLILGALALAIYGASDGYVGMRARRLALLGLVLLIGLVYAATGGDVAAVENTLSAVLCTAAMGMYVLVSWSYVAAQRARRSGPGA